MKINSLKNISIHLNQGNEYTTKIGKLRHEAYLNCGAISRKTDSVFLDNFDKKNNVFNHYALKNDSDLVGAIRGVIYDPNASDQHTLPSFAMFKEEINTEIGLKNKLIESCRFVVHPHINKRLPVNLALIKSICILSYVAKCDHTITAVREKHLGFYQKMGFYKCSDPKIYPGLNIKMVLLMGKDSRKSMDHHTATFKHIAHTAVERQNYAECLEKLS